MAITLAEAIVYFKGDGKQLSSDMDTAKGKVGNFAGTATKLIGGAVVGAAVAAGAAIVGVGVAALNVSKDTDQAAADMAASLGIPIAEAERFAEVAKRVYGNNFADSVGDAATAVEGLAKQLGITADDPALQTMAENAFRLRDVFDLDVGESIDAVKSLMDSFGISAEQAFDLVAAGNQKGLNRSGDLIDTITEYSNQFAAGGASAGEFFSILEAGSLGGMLGTDKAADAFKEFVLRIQDGSTLTAQSLDAIGLSADDIVAGLSDGSLSIVDVWNQVQTSLQNTEDPLVQFNSGVGLLGSQFEDLTADIASNMTATNDWSTASAGAIDSLDAKYNTFGAAVDGMWRRLVVSVSPFTDKLLELVNSAMPSVMAAFDAFDAKVGPVMMGMQTTIDNVVGFVKGLFQSDLSGSVDGAAGRFDFIGQKVNEIMPLIQQVIQTVLGAISTFWNAHGETILRIVGNVFDTALIVISGAMSLILDAIKLVLQLLTGDWEGAWNTLKDMMSTALDTITGVLGNKMDTLRAIFTGFDLYQSGRAFIDNFWRGIMDKFGEWEDWYRRKLQALRNLLPFSEPKDPSSPLRGLRQAGQGLVEQVQKGIDESAFGLGNVSLNNMLSPQGAGTGMGTSIGAIHVHLNGDGTYEGGREAGRGLIDELRSRGLA